MASIDWGEGKYFSWENFSEDPEEHAEPALLYTLDDYRGLLGYPLYPSPVKGGLARFRKSDEGSRHCARNKKRSDASDQFPDQDPARAVLVALTSRLWGGVGLYLDTKLRGIPWPMLHLDLRPLGYGHSQRTVLVWIRRDGEYIYPQYRDGGGAILGEALRIREAPVC